VGAHGIGFDVDRVAVRNFVDVIFELLVETWYVLDVVGIQGALIHLTVGQLEIIKLDDLNVQAGVVAQLVVNIYQNLAVDDRDRPDLQSGNAIVIGFGASGVVVTTARSQDQSGGSCNTGQGQPVRTASDTC